MTTAQIWNSARGTDDFGSVGCLARVAGQEAVLSASHVLCPVWRDVVPGSLHRLTVLGDLFADGDLVNWSSPLGPDGAAYASGLDVAIGTLASGSHASLIGSQGLPADVGVPRKGASVRFNGARTGSWRSTRIDDVGVDAPIVCTLIEGEARVSALPVTLGGMIRCLDGTLSKDGDSGCLLVDEHDLALGLLVGHDVAMQYLYFAPLATALQRFGAQLLTRQNTPGAPALH